MTPAKRQVGCLTKVILALSSKHLPIDPFTDNAVRSWDHTAYVVTVDTPGLGRHINATLEPKWGVISISQREDEEPEAMYRRAVDQAAKAAKGLRLPFECHYWVTSPQCPVLEAIRAAHDRGATLHSHTHEYHAKT